MSTMSRTMCRRLSLCLLAVGLLVGGLARNAPAGKAVGHAAVLHAVSAGPTTMVLGLSNHACKKLSAAQWNRVLTVMRHRGSDFKPKSEQIARSGPCTIHVVVTGIRNPSVFAAALAARGHLVFYGMGQLPQLSAGAPFRHPTAIRCDAPKPPTPCVVIDGSDLDLSAVGLSYDSFGAPQVNFGARKEGARRLATYTGTHVGSHMAIVLDNTVVTDPTIVGALPGSGVINNIGSIDEAPRIAGVLKSGELPAAFKVLSIR